MIRCPCMIAKRPLLLAGALFLAALAPACAPDSPRLHGSPVTSPASAPAIDLADTAGAPFRLDELLGNVVLIYFGYTQCPDECPLTLANASWMVEQLGVEGERLSMVLITVDPEVDSPQVLRAYLDHFNPRFIGLTGSEAQLAQARLAYGVPAATPGPVPGHSEVIHGTRLYLVDPLGRLATSYDMSVPKEDILDDVRAILKAGT